MEHLFKRIVPLSSPQDRSRSMSELLTDSDYSKRFLLGLRDMLLGSMDGRRVNRYLYK